VSTSRLVSPNTYKSSITRLTNGTLVLSQMSNQVTQQLSQVTRFAPVAMKRLRESLKASTLLAERSMDTTLTVVDLTQTMVFQNKLFPASSLVKFAISGNLVHLTIR
jgi:hypothetical protein